MPKYSDIYDLLDSVEESVGWMKTLEGLAAIDNKRAEWPDGEAGADYEFETFELPPTLVELEPWTDHPTYPMSDWRYEVSNQDTQLGYRDWLYDKLEQDRFDAEDMANECTGN